MKILVTGVSGFIGGYVGQYLQRCGHKIVGLARNRQAAGASGFLNMLYADLADGFPYTEPVDAIIHAAAQSPAEGVTTADYIRSNIESVKNLIAYARSYQVKKCIYLSSLSIYGTVRQPVLNEQSLRIDPDIYGMTKFAGELLFSEQEASLACVVLRLPGVVGAGARTPWLARTAARMMQNEGVSIYNPQALFNNVVHVANLAEFIEYLLAKEWNGMRPFTLGSSDPLTVRQVVETLKSALRSSSLIEEHPALESSFIVGIDSAVAFGYQPLTTRHAIERYAQDLLEMSVSKGK